MALVRATNSREEEVSRRLKKTGCDETKEPTELRRYPKDDVVSSRVRFPVLLEDSSVLEDHLLEICLLDPSRSIGDDVLNEKRAGQRKVESSHSPRDRELTNR